MGGEVRLSRITTEAFTPKRDGPSEGKGREIKEGVEGADPFCEYIVTKLQPSVTRPENSGGLR